MDQAVPAIVLPLLFGANGQPQAPYPVLLQYPGRLTKE